MAANLPGSPPLVGVGRRQWPSSTGGRNGRVRSPSLHQRRGDPAAHGAEVVVEDRCRPRASPRRARRCPRRTPRWRTRRSSRSAVAHGLDRRARPLEPLGCRWRRSPRAARRAPASGRAASASRCTRSDDLDLDAGRLVERLADVPRPVRGLRPRRPVEREVGPHPGRQALAGQAVGRLPGHVAEQHVDLEALLEGLPFEEGPLERVAERADGVGEDVVEHGVGRLSVPPGAAAGGSAADITAIGTDTSSPVASVAIRRPACTAAFGSPMRPARWAAVASMSATVKRQAPEGRRSLAGRLGGPDDLEDHLAQPEEPLPPPTSGLAGAPGLEADAPRAPRWCGRGRGSGPRGGRWP